MYPYNINISQRFHNKGFYGSEVQYFQHFYLVKEKYFHIKQYRRKIKDFHDDLPDSI